MCDVSKVVIIDCDVSEAKHVPFLVLANNLFVVLEHGDAVSSSKETKFQFLKQQSTLSGNASHTTVLAR